MGPCEALSYSRVTYMQTLILPNLFRCSEREAQGHAETSENSYLQHISGVGDGRGDDSREDTTDHVSQQSLVWKTRAGRKRKRT